MIRHLVLLRWKEDAGAEAIRRAIEGVQDLRGIEGVLDVVVHENLGLAVPVYGKGIRHILVVTLADLDALERYGPHPLHQGVGELLLPIAEELTIVDHFCDETRQFAPADGREMGACLVRGDME